MTNRCFLRCPVWEQATHHFPNHIKHHDRFKAWVGAIDRMLETDADYEYFRTKRLCHIHFKPIFCYNNKRLSPLAIPTLYLTKESRDEYWSKDLELRKSMLKKSKSPKEEISKDEVESLKDDTDLAKNEGEIPKDEAETNNKDRLMDVAVETLPSNNTQSSVQADVEKSLVNLLITDILDGENEIYIDNVQENPLIDFLSPIESNVPNPVADIIIEYVSKTEVSDQKLLLELIPRDVTSEVVVENLPPEPILIHDLPLDSTILETSAEEIEIKFDGVKNCIQQPKNKCKCKSIYDGIFWELALRIPMEHNYSKASIVAPTSHMSSNGMHPKKTIIALKKQVKELRKKLKFYKQKCKDLLLNQNLQTVTLPIKSKKNTKTTQKGPTTHKKAYKNVITYLKLKNAGCGISLPRNI